MRWTIRLALVVSLGLGTSPVLAQDARLKSPARMDGNPLEVALRAIQLQFVRSDCPTVVQAARQGDGSITARCSNGQTFGIANVSGVALAMRCSAARDMEASGCPQI